MSDHHLVMGELRDFLTGETLPDTHDERYRQKIARLLVEEKGYSAGEIEPRRELVLEAGEKRARITVDLIVRFAGQAVMILQYGPGSLVSRHRPALSISRLVERYQVPVVVVTNGEQADILDGTTSRPVASGLGAIPSRQELKERRMQGDFAPVSPETAKIESRIAFAYEIECSCSPGEKSCDD